MKKLRITVSGKVYDVEVQVLQDDEAIGSAATLPYPGAATAPMTEAARPAPAPAPAPVAGGAGDPNVIASPIAGTVQKVFVTKGMHVEGKTPVVLLDAMKMDGGLRGGGRVRPGAGPAHPLRPGGVTWRS